MTSYLSALKEKYDEIWELRDLRVEDWPLMSSPLWTLSICLTYVMIVKVWGPSYMKDRKPFEFRQTLVYYNAFQVIFSAWLVYELGQGGWFHGYSFTCQPVDYSDNPMALRVAGGCWWYYIAKFTEFFDTFFFVMRKKYDQVSLLHVVHHGIMPMSVWFGIRFTPGGHSSFFAILNSFVHVVMYFYYMVAAMGPQYQKYIWWKKHLTTFQMVQFVAIFTHAFQLFFIECDYPIAFAWWIGGHGVLFLILFSDFYVKSYLNKRKQKTDVTNESRSPPLCLFSDVYDEKSTTSSAKKSKVNGQSTEGQTNGHVKQRKIKAK